MLPSKHQGLVQKGEVRVKIRLREGVLYAICKDLGISRDELARRLKIANTTAWRIDSGAVEPSPKFIASLMTFTEKKFEQLFEVVDEDAA
jgi:transcriptional regulator with XRE-family HTH domain